MKAMDEFRDQIKKIMPGYRWTIKKPSDLQIGEDGTVGTLEATGIQTSGMNRISTLLVVRRKKGEEFTYTVKSSGYGLRSPWRGEREGTTLAKALRSLQDYYESQARDYAAHAHALQAGRQKPQEAT